MVNQGRGSSDRFLCIELGALCNLPVIGLRDGPDKIITGETPSGPLGEELLNSPCKKCPYAFVLDIVQACMYT